jgi:hemolysin activation/secretion protein
MDIVPVPERPGYGRLVIDNTPQDRFRSRISVDNYGAQSTGRNQNRLVLDVDNLLWLNDQWFVSGSRYAGDRDDRDSESLTVNMSLPYGYWTIDLSHSYSSYLNTVSDATGRFELSGDSQTTRLTADRVVHRDRHSKTGLGLALTRRENESFLEDVLLQTSSRTLSVFTVEADHVQRVSSGVWSYALRYARGLDAFGALQDGPIREDDVPRAQFEKIGLDVSALHDLDLAGLGVSYRGLLSGQISRDPLFGSEQLALGDQGTVRGFLDLPVAGDSGMFLRNDFIWSANGKSSLTRGLNLSVGLDLGYVEAVSGSIGNSGQDDAWIAGAALGLSQSIALPWWDQALSWSAVYARPLREPDFIEADDYVVYARLDWKWW